MRWMRLLLTRHINDRRKTKIDPKSERDVGAESMSETGCYEEWMGASRVVFLPRQPLPT
jgi:hypothetical protein